MLEIVNYGQDEYGYPCLLVLGCFDAVHAGHADLLKKASLQAKINGLDLGIMTFTDGKGGELVTDFDERLKLFEAFKAKFVLKIDYTEEFKNTSCNDFLAVLDEKLNLKGLMSGKDFRFGAGAKGKSSTLKNYADNEDNGVWYTAVKDLMYNDEKISTTMIKEMLQNGDIRTANELLKRCYAITGTVSRGAGRGTQMGFPTMNVSYPENKVKVKEGVYAVKCNIGGTEYKGIANYGARPTFDEEEPILEVHLEGFGEEYYGNEVRVEFTDYLRDIIKFSSADELKEQLQKDISAIK